MDTIDINGAETAGDLDTEAIANQIGESLFSKPSAEPVVKDNPLAADIQEATSATKPVEAVVAPAAVEPAAPAIVSGENSEAKPLPKSWKKELAPEWEKASPVVKAYVHEREAQIMRGINQYSAGYQAWESVVKPFEPILQANPDVNPVALMQGLMATHLQLLSPTVSASDKQTMVKNLLTNYGISLEPGTGPAADSILLERLAKTETLLQQMHAAEKRREATSKQESLNTFQKQVNDFSSDPKNEYFSEVANDILRFVGNGAADSLASAYELACWANPAVRAKMIAKQQITPNSTAQKPRGANGQFLNVESEGEPRKITVKAGTMEDTINTVVAKHYPKH